MQSRGQGGRAAPPGPPEFASLVLTTLVGAQVLAECLDEVLQDLAVLVFEPHDVLLPERGVRVARVLHRHLQGEGHVCYALLTQRGRDCKLRGELI